MTTIAETQAQIERIWRSSFQTELDAALEIALRKSALTGVRATLEAALQEELRAHLGFERYERQAEGAKAPERQRSGYFPRQVHTEYGTLPDLRIPKLRRGNPERDWQVLTRYQSARQTVLDKALYLYSLGLSVRDLEEALFLFLGQVLSRTAVNRVTLAAQSQMEAWRSQPLTETPPVLIVDGVWVTILYPTGETWTDQRGHERQRVRGEKRVILAVMGVWPDGRHHLLHYEVAADENAETWKACLAHLIARGLQPALVQLVGSDGTNGLLEAMQTHLPQAKSQRCTEHKARGLERYLTYQDLPASDAQTGTPLPEATARQQRRQEIQHEARQVFQAETETEARQRLEAFVTKWETVEPKAVHSFTWGIQRCFTFYQFDTSLHPLIRSTNLLERFFREFRNKADEIGAFPNETSGLTVFYLVMAREHAKHNRVDFAKTERH